MFESLFQSLRLFFGLLGLGLELLGAVLAGGALEGVEREHGTARARHNNIASQRVEQVVVAHVFDLGHGHTLDHLGEDQRNSITNLNTLLRNHAAEVKCHDCQDTTGAPRTLCLIFSACSKYKSDGRIR